MPMSFLPAMATTAAAMANDSKKEVSQAELDFYASVIAKKLNLPLPSCQEIAKSPKVAFEYARKILQGPFPLGEAAIASESYTALEYALQIKGRFPLGEAIIAQNAERSLTYARDVLNGYFPAGEAAIASDAKTAYEYAKDVLNAQWPCAEPILAIDQRLGIKYAKEVLHDRFLALEPNLRGYRVTEYFDHFKCRMPLVEPNIPYEKIPDYLITIDQIIPDLETRYIETIKTEKALVRQTLFATTYANSLREMECKLALFALKFHAGQWTLFEDACKETGLQKPLYDKLVGLNKADHECEATNVGFTSVILACKTCGRNM